MIQLHFVKTLENAKKKCTDCKKYKFIASFYKRYFACHSSKHEKHVTLSSICKKCLIKRTSLWQKANKEKRNKCQREYYKRVQSHKALMQ